MKIPANDPQRKSWVPVPDLSDFPIQNLPFGIYSDSESDHHVCTAIGEHVLDLYELHTRGYLTDLGFKSTDFAGPFLNPMMKNGKGAIRNLRNKLAELLDLTDSRLRNNDTDRAKILKSQSAVTMHLPVEVGDYTDFYSSIEHATNVGTMFRDPDNALLPNWKHIPVGYHGRSSSIIVSGQSIHRPNGQTRPDDNHPPVFGPSRLLDFELEMAFVTFDGKPLGETITTGEAEDYIFGMLIFNDWSARDIQKWEYVPLGPFLAKNFASCVSPWIVTLDALDAFRVKGEPQDPPVLPYLQYEGEKNIDIQLEVGILPEDAENKQGGEKIVSRSNYKYMYWNMNQQLAHHTINGCNIRCGDMLASGTISGKEPSSFGSMLEISWRGTKPVQMPDGSERKFINDGDTVIMRGHCQNNQVRIGFGEVRTKVLPAKKFQQ